MKTYNVMFKVSVDASVEVEANSEEEAIEEAQRAFERNEHSIDDLQYDDDSFEAELVEEDVALVSPVED